MRGYVYRLLGPRPDFMTTMSDDERSTMGAHAAYWAGLMAEGKVLAFGPVADPAGAYGIGIVLAQDMAEAEGLRAADPAIMAPHGLHAEIAPMVRLVTPDGVFNSTL